MRALVVYESMSGNTRSIAEALAGVLDRNGLTTTLTTASYAPASVEPYELVIIGAPTHGHSLPFCASRAEAVSWAADSAKSLTLETSADGDGVREWLARVKIPPVQPAFAVFSTRVDIPRIFAGDSAVTMQRRLRSLKVEQAEKESFLVSSSSQLVDGERERAKGWATRLMARLPVPA